jgi:hypothetical protein
MSDILDAAKKLVDTVEFDCNGVNGKGGNGGLLSDATIKAAGTLRIALSRANSQPARQAETSDKPSPGNQAITGETARGEPCDLPPPIHPHPSPVDRGTVPCECTKIAQDDSCPIGYPSLLCEICDSKGDVPAIKLDGSELWEIVFGIANDTAAEITDEQYQQIADAINNVFIEPIATAPADKLLAPDDCPICAERLVPDDICASDIELGICHAACLEGSTVVDLNTGEEIVDGKIDTYRYGDDPLAANLNAQCRRGDWMQTATGRQFWPLDPRADDIDIEDIAHALSMMCRFGGHCDRFYSVAEHSVLVSENVPPEDALWALLHDASEAYIADIVRPAKRFIAGYKDIEAGIMSAVRIRFNLSRDEPASVKRADNAILADEAAQIMGTKPKDWILPEPPLGVRIIGLSPAGAKLAFLNRYRALTEVTAHG